MRKINETKSNSESNCFGLRRQLALAALLLAPVVASHADSFWVGPSPGSASYNTPNDWNPVGVPLTSNGNVNADNDNGTNSIITIGPADPAWNPWDIRAGNGAGAGGTYIQTGSTVTVGGWFRLGLGDNSAGYYFLSNGVVNCDLQAHVGEASSGTAFGYLEIDGGTFNVNQDPFCMGDGDFGQNPVGVLVMNGGTINTAIGVEIWLGEGHNNTVGGQGTMYMNGGSVNIGNWFAIGRFGGIGDLEMNGGSITMIPGNDGNITLATTPSTAVVNQNGGAITNTVTQTWVGESGTATWNLTNGVDVLGIVHITHDAGANGTFNLAGGDLWANQIVDNGQTGGSVFNFLGGTLHAGVSSPNFMPAFSGSVNVYPGGAKIDTAGNDITIAAQLFDAGGGLTKLGAGTLTLSGINYYSGPTVVSNGVLITTTASGVIGPVTVRDGAGFGVTVVSPGTQYTPSSLTLGQSTGASLNFDLGSSGNPTAAPLSITPGTLTLNGTITVNVADEFPQVGVFHLVQYSTLSGSGSFVLGTYPAGVQCHLVNNAGYLDLDITSVGFDIWDGLAGGNWDIATSTNWVNGTSLTPVTYHDGDAVQFDDTATGTTTINLVSAVQPGSVLFTNTVNSYTLQGAGTINGSTTLSKDGTNTLTINNTNAYKGATILNLGTVIVTNLANGGLPSAIGASSAGATNLVLNGGTLSYAGSPVTINRGLEVAYNYGLNGGAFAPTNWGTLDLEGNLNIGGNVSAAVGTSFVKTGPGTLTFSGVGTNQLSGGNDPGFEVRGGTLVFDGSAGPQVNHSQQEFWVGDYTNSGANIILTNTTLNIDSWFSLSRGNGNYGWVCNGSFYNSTLNCANFSLGWENGRPNLCSQNLLVTNSTINDGGAFFIAESGGSVGVATIAGNSVLTMGYANPMLMGLSSGATGTVVVANNSIVTNHDWLSCGANGWGELVLKDNAFYGIYSDFNFGDYGAANTTGILILTNNAQVQYIGSGGNGVYVGKTAGSFGVVYQYGNTLVNTRLDGVWQLGQQAGASGTWYQYGGTNYAGGWLSIGRGYTAGDVTPTGLYIVSGGLLDQVSAGNALIVGEQGTGQLIVTNNGVVISESRNLGLAIGWNGGVGEVDLGGGLLVANWIESGVSNNNLTGYSTFNFNGGVLRAGPNSRLNFMSQLNTATILSGATIDTAGNTISIAQPLLDGGMGGGLTKIGTGTLLLDGANTYSGTTMVSAGTLGGTGTIAGPVVVSSGAALAPGDSALGTITLNSTLSLASGSTTVMLLNKTAATSSKVSGASSVTYGGTLVLQNTSGTLQAGDSFQIFAAGGYNGSFSSVVSYTPGQTVVWDLSQLTVSGTVKVASAVATPVNIVPVVSGGNLVLSWPPSQTGFELLEQVDPLNVGLGTNWVLVSGSATTNQVSIPVSSTPESVFFRLFFP